MNTKPQLSAITDFTILGVKGPDSQKFLQGQVTCDINQVSPTNSSLGAHCDRKGRMISNFRALSLNEEHVGLRLQRELLPVLQAALSKYIVFSKAELIDHAEEFRLMGLEGEQAAILVEQTFGIQFSDTTNAAKNELGHFIRLSATMVECWLATDKMDSFTQQLQGKTEPANPGSWQLACIRAGLGETYPQTSGEWIPQMLNYQIDALAGISFSKGCYTGQEIVARMQYLGKLKRHMYRLQTPITLQPGQQLFSQGKKQSVGEVVMAATAAAHTECLAVVTTAAVDSDNIFLDSEGNQPLSVLPLPYTVTPAITN